MKLPPAAVFLPAFGAAQPSMDCFSAGARRRTAVRCLLFSQFVQRTPIAACRCFSTGRGAHLKARALPRRLRLEKPDARWMKISLPLRSGGEKRASEAANALKRAASAAAIPAWNRNRGYPRRNRGSGAAARGSSGRQGGGTARCRGRPAGRRRPAWKGR